MVKRDFFKRLTISASYRRALVALSVVEIVLAISSIGLAIAAIILARQNYLDCYAILQSTTTSCDYYPNLNTYSLTSQGIWVGVMVLISASIAIDFTRVPSWSTWTYTNGFTTIANTLSGAMITLEAFAVADYIAGGQVPRRTNDYALWCIHVTLISLACALWIICTAKNITVSRVRAWGKVAVADSDISLQNTPQPAVYRIPG